MVDGNGATPGTNDPTTLLPTRLGATDVTLLSLGSIQGHDELAGSASLTNLAPRSALVEAGELRQLNNIVSAINPEHSEASKRLEVATSGAVYLAASRVSSSGDPVTLLALED